jgi:hypothetical protein
LGVLFEESPGDPLTSAEANALVESLRVYRDANGSGVFEPATDALVTSVPTLTLTGGVATVAFVDGDANVQVAVGTPRAYFVVVELTTTASGQVPNRFRVTLLQTGASRSVVEDRTVRYPAPPRLSGGRVVDRPPGGAGRADGLRGRVGGRRAPDRAGRIPR